MIGIAFIALVGKVLITLSLTKFVVTLECAHERYYNDDEANTFTFHLRIANEAYNDRRYYVLHSKQHPIDEGIIVEDLTVKEYPPSKLFLEVQLRHSLFVNLYVLVNKTAVIAYKYSFINGQFKNVQKSRLGSFTHPIRNFHAAFRKDVVTNTIFNRENCESLTGPKSKFCMQCRPGLGENCVYDNRLRWQYALINDIRWLDTRIGDLVAAHGCYFFFEQKNLDLIPNARNVMFVIQNCCCENGTSIEFYKPQLRNAFGLINREMKSCYEIKGGIHPQIVVRNWNGPWKNYCANSYCTDLPIESYPPSHFWRNVIIGAAACFFGWVAVDAAYYAIGAKMATAAIDTGPYITVNWNALDTFWIG